MKFLAKFVIWVLIIALALVVGRLSTGYELSFAGTFDPKYAVIWSGVLGAFIAAIISLVGVIAANKSSLDRLAVQHTHDKGEAFEQRKHDAEQKDEDRKAAIRREVYTEAVVEMHAVLGIIGSIPDRPMSDSSKDSDGLQLFLKANSKVWLVAESEAAHLSRELTSLMSELYLHTVLTTRPLRIAMEPVRALERQVAHAESEIVRIDGRIAELKEQRADNELFEAAVQSWTNTTDWLKSLKIERDKQMRLLGPERLKHMRTLLEKMQPVQRIIVRMVSALRKEIHLPADEVQFLEELVDMEARGMAIVNRAYGIDAINEV
jgi:hypothetical protein